MTNDDVLYATVYGARQRAELGSVAALPMHGIHRSTFYRCKAMSDRFYLEILRPRSAAARRCRTRPGARLAPHQRLRPRAPGSIRRASPLS